MERRWPATTDEAGETDDGRTKGIHHGVGGADVSAVAAAAVGVVVAVLLMMIRWRRCRSWRRQSTTARYSLATGHPVNPHNMDSTYRLPSARACHCRRSHRPARLRQWEREDVDFDSSVAAAAAAVVVAAAVGI